MKVTKAIILNREQTTEYIYENNNKLISSSENVIVPLFYLVSNDILTVLNIYI